MLPRLALTFALAVVVLPRSADAQASSTPLPQPAVETQQYDAPAYVAVVDGSATLERDGRVESAPLNMPLLSGDRLRTTDGRMEVRFSDGGRLHVDARTSLDILSDTLVRLGDGRIRILVQRAPQVSYRIDSTAGSARVTEAGEYRIALIHGERETQLEFAVVRGAGELFTEQGSTPVRSGERAYASAGLMPSYAYTYNSATMDDFDRWSEMQRGTVYAGANESSQYLPADMSSYASTFDQYGDWRYQQSYGYVWYPRVATGWRPYYYGRWAPYPAYGWTWIAGDPFGYPTHHYGRWGFSANAWFWIPRPYWGPAYVSWGYAPSYVSWCPLGWNNTAVFSIGFYNVGPAYYAGHYRGQYYTAWTTVPHGYFGHGYYAHQHAVSWDRAGYSGARPRFTEGRIGPSTGDVAVARGTAVRYAGTRVVTGAGAVGAVDRGVAARAGSISRTESPRYVNRGDQIVRSQTERPTPPRSSGAAPGVTRRTDGAPARQSYVWDSPSRSDTGGRAVDRATPRTMAPIGRERAERTAPQPSSGAGAVQMYDRPYRGDRVFDNPNRGDRAYERPSVGDRAYERPSAGERAYERPGGRMEPGRPTSPERPSAPAARPIDRPGPPPAPAGRAMERSSPPPPPSAAPSSRSGGGGDRAVPRSGGSPAPSGHRGGGRSR